MTNIYQHKFFDLIRYKSKSVAFVVARDIYFRIYSVQNGVGGYVPHNIIHKMETNKEPKELENVHDPTWANFSAIRLFVIDY